MSISIGIDLTATDAVAQSLRIHGERYLGRVYTERERRDCARPPGCPDAGRPDAVRLAARFAAKEATLKALRREDEAIPWTSIGVCTDGAGRPTLELTGAAAALARRRGVAALSVSLTHEGGFAAAVVAADLGDPPA
jgi:holo-[acyl-carrier protein] synthase